MKDEDFKKVDEWMMSATKRERDQRVPEKEMQDFHDGVMKKILERQNAGPGLPYLGLGMAAALSLAVIFGAAFYIQSVRVEKPVVAEETKQVSAPHVIPAEAGIQEVKPSGSPIKAFGDDRATVPTLSESEIVDEIEALKELGVWTEEDEEEAGIPVEVTFGDLETGFETAQAPPAPAPV